MLRFGRTVRILSIDGGGIRGIIPSLVLQRLQTHLRRAGHSGVLARYFDLIAGTSTGGLIALALARPRASLDPDIPTEVDVPDLVAMYRNRGKQIFPQWRFRQFQTVAQAFTEKYDAKALEFVLRENFGDLKISGARTGVLVTGFDLERMRPVLFCGGKSARDTELRAPGDYLFRDVARATSAAPTFFEPVRVTAVDGAASFAISDGFLATNDPALLAVMDARRRFPAARRYEVLSVGTGQSPGYPYESVKEWGALDWASTEKGVPLISMVAAGQAEVSAHVLAQTRDVRYTRLQAKLGDCSASMDDARAQTIACLEEAAADLIRRQDRELAAFVGG